MSKIIECKSCKSKRTQACVLRKQREQEAKAKAEEKCENVNFYDYMDGLRDVSAKAVKAKADGIYVRGSKQ